ncbi:CPBP family intramembrane glutamic endopeptidase [Chloroflexota bacterium]
MKNLVKKHPITTYLVIAYGITWLGWIPALIISSKHNYLLPTLEGFAEFVQAGISDTNQLLVVVAFQLAVYGPLIGALIVTRLTSGKQGVHELWGRVFKLRIGGRWYLNALLVALALAVIPFILVILIRLVGFSSVGLLALAPFILPLLLLQVLTSGFGEEPGWRGFLLPRLQAKYGGEKYIWYLGLIWAVWHYPFTIYHTLLSMVDVPVPAMIVAVIMALAGNTMSIIGMTYIYVWLNNKTKSVFLAILFHAVTNTANTVVFASLDGFHPLMAIIIGITPWGVIIVMQKILGKDKFPGSIINA